MAYIVSYTCSDLNSLCKAIFLNTDKSVLEQNVHLDDCDSTTITEIFSPHDMTCVDLYSRVSNEKCDCALKQISVGVAIYTLEKVLQQSNHLNLTMLPLNHPAITSSSNNNRFPSEYSGLH